MKTGKKRTKSEPAPQLKRELAWDDRLPAILRFLGLLALAFAALAYPWDIPSEWVRFLHEGPGEKVKEYGWKAAFRAFFHFSYSPLVLKETLAGWVFILMGALWISWKVLRPPRKERPRIEVAFLLAFLAWALIGMMRAPHFGMDMDLLYNGINVSLWILFALILIDIPFPESFQKRATAFLLGLGAVLMLISIGQAVDETAPYVFKVLRRTAGKYNRNLFGSLIGHNTGVAALGMTLWFFALAGLFTAKSLPRRVFFLFYALMSGYFFLITQSRSVWIFLTLLTPLFLLTLFRVESMQFRLRPFLIGLTVLLILLLSQTLPFPGNFFHVEQVDYLSRLRGMNPSVVIEGTRFRILLVILPLLLKAPFFGHGLGSFSLLYPHGQAAYFTEHPFSFLRPTTLQTQRAHDDYLQLALELGLVGIILAGLTLFFFLRRGWMRFHQLEQGPEKVRRLSAAFAVLSLLLIAWVDFPFHIAPLAAFFVFLAVLAYGDNREWREDSPAQPREKALTKGTLRPAKVGRLVGVGLLWLLLLLPATSPFAFLAKRLKADRLFTRGSHYYLTSPGMAARQGTDAQKDHLYKARSYLKQSLRVQPLAFLPQLHLGLVNLQLADLFLNQAWQARDQQKNKEAEGFHARARAHVLNARENMLTLSRMSRQRAELRAPDLGEEPLGPRLNHTTLYVLARCWLLVDWLEPNHPHAVKNAWDYLTLTLRFCPIQGAAIMDLWNLEDRHGLGSEKQKSFILKQFAFYAPQEFEGLFIKRLDKIRYRYQLKKAEKEAAYLLNTVKEPSRFQNILIFLAWVYTLDNPQPEKLAPLMKILRAHYPGHSQVYALNLYQLAANHNWPELEKQGRELMRLAPEEPELGAALLSEGLRHQGKSREARRLFQKQLALSPKPAVLYGTRSYLRRAAGDALWQEDFLQAQILHPSYPEQGPRQVLFYLLLLEQARDGRWDDFDKALQLARIRLDDPAALLKEAERMRHAD